MSFDQFVPLWNTHPNQDIDYFCNLKKFPWAPFQLMMSPQRQLPQISVACSCVCTLSRVQLCGHMGCGPPDSSVRGIFQARLLEWVLVLEFHINGITNVWLLSLNKLLVRFAHMGVYLSHLFFFLRSMSPLSGFTTFIQSPVSEHVSCFQFGAIINKVSMNIVYRSFCEDVFLFLLY